MAIFDKELINNRSDRNYSKTFPDLPSPAPAKFASIYGAPLGPSGFFEENPTETGLTIAEMGMLREGSRSFNSPHDLVSRQELIANQKYPLYQRGVDLENIYGLQQSALSRIGNGLVKMGATAVGTFAQGFATIPNTVKAIKRGDWDALSGDPEGYEASIDQWLKNIEDYFPNYYTREEREHPFKSMIPFMPGSANFWGDKIIKNLGFTVGTISSVFVQDALITAMTGGIGTVPLVSAQVGKAALWMNKLFVTERRVDKVLDLAKALGKSQKQLSNIKKLGQLAATRKLTNGVRYGVNMYGAARTEAAIEARDGREQVYKELVRLHKVNNLGKEPIGADLQEINNYATNAMNTRFGINLAILSVSNAVQFDNLFRSFATSQKGVSASVVKSLQGGKIALKEGSKDVFEKVGTKGIRGAVWKSIKPRLPLVFSEGVWEEGGQYATEKGTYDYYTRKYKDPGKKSNKESWDFVNEAMKSVALGLSEQFGSEEGIEQMIIGAISAIITGGALGQVDRIKGQNKNERLTASINALNQYGLTGILHNKYTDTVNSVAIAKDMKAASNSGNIYDYKNLKHDLFYQFVSSRIPAGMHDVTIEQLNLLKDLSEEEFESTFGMDFTASNKSTVIEYVDTLISKANEIAKTTEGINNTFTNPFKNNINPISAEEKIETAKYLTFENWKKEIGYLSSIEHDINSRILSMNERLSNINPLLNVEQVSSLTNKESLITLSKKYEEESNQLSASILPDSAVKYKRETKARVKTLRTAAERINLALSKNELDDVFLDILNFELNNQDPTKSNVIGFESIEEIYKIGIDTNKLEYKKRKASEIITLLTSEKGFDGYFESQEKVSAEVSATPEETEETEETPSEIVFKNNLGEDQTVEEGREYELASIKRATVRKSGDRFRIKAPDGTITFQPTREEAKQEAADINADLNDLAKVRVLAFNPDGTVKIEDLSGNIQNISPEQLTGYNMIETEQDRLLKKKEQLGKEQDNIEHEAGTIPTVENYYPTKEPKLKEANILYISTTTESEDWEDTKSSSPHIIRSREFLNNISFFENKENMKSILVTPHQAKVLGLEGIVQMSYKVSAETDLKSIKNVEDTNLGFVGAVFVIQEKDKVYFVDKDGNKLTEVGEKADLSKIVFQTMPTVSLANSKGLPRYRAQQKKEAEEQSAAWGVYRNDLFGTKATSNPILHPFIVSKGIGVELKNQGVREENPVTVLKITPEIIEEHKGLIVIPTTGSISHNEELQKFPNGIPVLHYGYILEHLNNKKFNEKEVKTIYEVLKALAADTIAQSESGSPIRLNRDYITYLQNVLFWKKGATVTSNQIRFNVDTMSIDLGSQSYLLTSVVEQEEAITNQLRDAYNAVNNKTLTTEKFYDPFYEYYVDENGTLSPDPIEWPNYQVYLLSSKNPDGSNRGQGNIPLTTSIAATSESIPYNYKQKYATLLGVGLKVPKKKKKITVETTGTINVGGHAIDGKTINKYDDVKPDPDTNEPRVINFTAGFDSNKYIVVDFPKENPVLKDFSEDLTTMTSVINPILVQIDLFESKDTDLERVKKFFQYRIEAQLNEILNKEETTEETPSTSISKKAVFLGEAYKGPQYQITKLSKDTQLLLNNLNVTEQEVDDFLGELNFELSAEYPENIKEKIKHEIDIISQMYKHVLPVKPKPKVPPKHDDSEGPSDDAGFRKVGKDSKLRMTDAELQLFKQWHAENVPFIPFEVLQNVIRINKTEKAWGVFEDGVAKFVKGGLRATEYHEIFEAIYKGILNIDEQQALLDEFRNRPGQFTDRQTKKKIDFADATDLQAKERIADDFADFREGKLPTRSIGEWLRNIFIRIIDWFKSFSNNPNLKSELFKAIDTGKFKERTLDPTVDYSVPVYRAIEGLTTRQSHEYIQDMTARAAHILYGDGAKGLLFTPAGITSKEVFLRIEAQYMNEYNKAGFSKREILGDTAWKQLIERTKLSLKSLGVSFNEIDLVNINEANTTNRSYAPEPFSQDWKKTSSGAIKFSLATILQVKATNQENKINIEVPKPKISSVGGYQLMNFSQVFATLLTTLSNTSGIGKAVDKITELANYDPNYVRLFKRLGGKLKKDKNGYIPIMSFEDFKKDDWRYFIQFMQVFTKQKPNALIQYKTGVETYTAPANLFTAIREVQNGWFENIKILAQSKDSFITYNKPSKTFQVKNFKGIVELNPLGEWRAVSPLGKIITFKEKANAVKAAKIFDISIKTPQDMVEFLGMIGVDFSLESYNILKSKRNRRKTSQQVMFARAVSSLYSYFGKNKDIMSITNKTLGISGPLSVLAQLLIEATNPNQENTHYGVTGEKMGSFADNNVPSVFENEFNEANTLDELLETRPELRDIYNKGSQVLKKGGLFFDKKGNRIKNMKVSYIQGTKYTDTNRGRNTTVLSKGERFTQEINQNLKGDYYIMIPADSSTEWMLNMGNHFKFSQIENKRAWTNAGGIYSIFKGYLLDDVTLALDADNRNHLASIGNRGRQLRFFKDILNTRVLKGINNLIAKNSTEEKISKYIDTNIEDINNSIKIFLDNSSERVLDVLKDKKEIVTTTSKESVAYAYTGLDDNFATTEELNKLKLSEKTVNDIVSYSTINYVINMIEYHKILFGDPYQFVTKKDGSLDATKRFKSFFSPRRTTFDSPEFNTFLNKNLNKTYSVDKGSYTATGETLHKKDPGYHKFKPYTNTLTIKDVIIAGSLSNLVAAYGKTDETDGMSWLMDGTYREIKLKNGQWSDEAEAWHQWQMAWTRQNMPGYQYTNTELQKYDKNLVNRKEPKHNIEVLKPIVSGNKANKNQFDIVLDKFAQMPIYYSMVKGTNLEKLYVRMMKEDIGYAVVQQGRKAGQEEVHTLYNGNGSFNEDAFNNIIQVPWKVYGIQVETSKEGGSKSQTMGSQLTKLASIDLFENGEPTSPEAKVEYEYNIKILGELHRNAYNTLLDKLGLEDHGDGFFMKDGKAISETLMEEMLRRQVSENVLDTIQLNIDNQFIIPFEASPAYIQIRNIMYSMIDKAIVHPKSNGGPHVQVPATMFESALKDRGLAMINSKGQWEKISEEKYESLSEQDRKKVMLTDDTLKFYTKEDPYCEIMLPHWFKGQLGKHRSKTDDELLYYLNNSTEGKEILKGIGFRIPTQALSSIEVFRVKGFLPQYMGDTVVVPSEITTKAGSDFDIDKLNMYLKSIYVDKDGNIHLIKYKGSEEETKEFYNDLFDKGELLTKKQVIDLNKSLSIAEASEEVDLLMFAMFEESGLFGEEDISEEFIRELSEGGIKKTLVNRMYKKSLENEYFSSLERLITLPENFDNLIAPITDAGLKKLSDNMNDLKGYDETKISNRLLDRVYMTSLRHSFSMGRKWVGIVATSITNFSIRQKSKTYIDTQKFNNVPAQDKKFLGDGSMALKHNTVTIEGKDYISLSGRTVKGSKEKISSRLSGYGTAVVDVAKDDFIANLIESDLIVGLVMLLENAGVGGKQTFNFLHQPIISSYLSMLDADNSRNLYNSEKIKTIKSKFNTKDKILKETELSIENLERDIITFYEKGSLNEQDNANQHRILDEFLKYAKMADYNFMLTQATNYDTSKYRSAETLTRKELRTEEAEETNIISSAKNILESTHIGEQAKLINKATLAMGAIFKLDSPTFRFITDSVLRTYGENQYLSADNYEKIALQVKASFLDYIIQTKSGLNSRIKELLVDTETSVALKLEKAKIDYPNIDLLKDLEITSGIRIDGAKSVKLLVNLKEAYDENLYIGMMRELRDYDNTTYKLYKELVLLSILQGTYTSPISIRNIIPIEDYSNIVSPIINSLNSSEDLLGFMEGYFERNNFKNDNVVPSFSPKFFQIGEEPIAEQMTAQGDWYADIYQYRSYLFPAEPRLSIKSNDRKLLFLNEKYNSFHLKNDFLKIPRVVIDKNTGEAIDMLTGQTITPMDHAKRKAKGDPALKDFFGYKKVKHIGGEPLLVYKQYKGVVSENHVYKLINLYGDSERATENYTDTRPTVIDNGTFKTSEFTDLDIINLYGGPLKEKDLSLPGEQTSLFEDEEFDNMPEFNKLPERSERRKFSTVFYRMAMTLNPDPHT